MGRKFTGQIQYEVKAIDKAVRAELDREGIEPNQFFRTTGSVRVDEHGDLYAEFIDPDSWTGITWISREMQFGILKTKEPSDW